MPTPPTTRPLAWRHWYHCTVGTYAQWLPGDPRGYRERNHHLHIAGDYKNPPPPSNFAQKRHASAKSLTQDQPYFIIPEARPQIGKLLLESFTLQSIPILALAVSAKNIHALIQCPNDRPKPAIGHAKRHVTLRFAPIVDVQTNTRQKIWEANCGVHAIIDRFHGIEALHYILQHREKENAWVWSYKEVPQNNAQRSMPTESAGLD